MGRKCTVCIHAQRADIDKSLLDVKVSMEEVARSHGLSMSSVARHRSKHLPELMSKAIQDRVSKGDAQLFDRTPAAVVPPAIMQHEQTEQEHAQELQEVRQMQDARDILLGGSLLERLADLQIQTAEILQEARGASKLRTALAAIARVEGLLELEAKLIGKLKENEVNLTQNVIYLPATAREEEWAKLAGK